MIGLRHSLLCLLTALMGACAVGPNFRRPASPAVPGYLPASAPAESGSPPTQALDTQQLLEGMAIPAQWWTLFRSQPLDELIRRALRNNPTTQAAQAALRQAQENYYAQLGTLLPTVQADYSFERQRNATGTLAPTLSSGQSLFNLHTAQVSVSYALDVFGGNRRAAESLHAAAEAQKYQLEATYLTLAANVVTTAIQEASVRAQLTATNDIVRSEREALQILRRQYQLGSIAMTDVMAQEATLATTEAGVPGLQKQLEQAQHALAVLAGSFPNSEPQQQFQLPGLSQQPGAAIAAAPIPAALQLPLALPLSLPSQLVRQRPDILQAEANLHAATAEVGVAIANMLPQFDLTALAGSAATQFAQLFAAGNRFWSGGASLTQTLFEGGTLLHRVRASRAAMDQAGAQYRSVVLSAFQNVADTLSALRLDAQAVEASSRAQQAAEQNLLTVRRNVELGSVGYLALLNAQQTYQQAVLGLAQAQANRYSDTAALFQALGGGWWNRKDPAAD